MFNDKNGYTLRVAVIGGLFHYFVSFKESGSAELREIKVSRPVYLEFRRFAREEHNQDRWNRRHIERSELTDQSLYDRALQKPKSVEDSALDNLWGEQLAWALAELPETMRRRFILYHDFGLTYDQIAEVEGCRRQPVMRSVSRAEEKIRKKFQEQGYVFGSECPNI